MSGHSKFSNIKHKKQAQDTQRSKIFQKYAQEIYTCAKMYGTNLDKNYALKKIIERASSDNMPKEKIQRTLDRIDGVNEFSNSIEITYEGYFHNSIAVLVHCSTNNRNRTTGFVKSVFRAQNLKLVVPGALHAVFDKQIFLTCDFSAIDNFDEFLLNLYDCDLESIDEENKESTLIKIKIGNYPKIKHFFEASKFSKINAMQMVDVPNFTVSIDDHMRERLNNFIDKLTAHEDVISVVTNAA